MSNDQSKLAVRTTASNALAAFIGMEPRMMLDTIKAQCFKGSRPDQISDAQLAAFVSIANEMQVNPLLPGMLYAYPSQGAIVPMMGPDGVFKKLSEHPQIDSWEIAVFPEDVTQPPTHATAKIYRKGVDRPLVYTAVLSEWKINNNPNWNSRPRHMLTIRALKQCARQIIHGIPFDEDEKIAMDMVNVTPEPVAPRPPPPERKKKGAAAIDAEVVTEKKAEAENAAAQTEALRESPTREAAQQEQKAYEKTPPVTPQSAAEAAPPKAAEVVIEAESHPDLEAAETPKPRSELAEGETLECEAEVGDVSSVIGKFKGADGNPVEKGVVTAEVSGAAFAGRVRCIGGASIQNGFAVPMPAWRGGTRLRLKLIGKRTPQAGLHVSVAAWEPVNPEAV